MAGKPNSVIPLTIMPLWERIGSGGPRGLQILMSGALGVRGGFDSHAFPPSLLLLATVLLPVALIGLPASADAPPGSPQGAPAAPLDSLRAPPVPDTAAVHIVEFGHTRTVTPTPAATLRFGEPRYVMMRSLLVPGWGQLYNRSWIKATLMAGIEGWLITGLVRDERQLTRLSREADDAQAVHDENAFNAAISAYNERLAQSINRRWLLGGRLRTPWWTPTWTPTSGTSTSSSLPTPGCRRSSRRPRRRRAGARGRAVVVASAERCR